MPEQVILPISIVKGDITEQQVDAIVNAANSSLLGGGGVDGAIHRVAGPELDVECRMLGGCATGDAVMTKGYNLPARFVIHTVGPIWKGGDHDEDVLLTSCYQKTLKLAISHDLKTISFSAISTGVYGFPLERATKIAVATVADYLRAPNSDLKVIFVCYSDETYRVYQNVLKDIAGVNAKKSLDKIQDTFMEKFEHFKIKIPEENLLERKPGSIPWSGSGRVMFVFGSSEGIEFMEYYGHHRMCDGWHGRIFEDGRHEDLPELGSFYGYDPKIPGDKEKKEEEYRKEYEKNYNELVERGLLSAGPVPCSLLIDSYLKMKKD